VDNFSRTQASITAYSFLFLHIMCVYIDVPVLDLCTYCFVCVSLPYGVIKNNNKRSRPCILTAACYYNWEHWWFIRIHCWLYMNHLSTEQLSSNTIEATSEQSHHACAFLLYRDAAVLWIRSAYGGSQRTVHASCHANWKVIAAAAYLIVSNVTN